jgi:hypothetical protein
MSLTPEAKALIAKVEPLGFTWNGKRDRRHHLVLEHPNGSEWSISQKPSDHRAYYNAIAKMEELSGKKLPRPKAGRIKNQARTRGFSDTYTPPSQVQWGQRIQALHREYRSLVVEFNVIASPGDTSKGDINRALTIIRRIAELDTFFEELNQPVPEVSHHLVVPSISTLDKNRSMSA